MSEHEHRWRGTLHMDGCHWYSWNLVCECGATAYSYAERDLNDDPYSAVWMDDEGRDEPCVRCGELLAGAKPTQRFEVAPAQTESALPGVHESGASAAPDGGTGA